MSNPTKAIPDLEFIPTAWAVTREGKAEPLSPNEHALVVLLQKGPATYEECMASAGIASIASLQQTIVYLRKKLRPMGVSVSSGNRLPGYYALVRVLK